MQTKEKHSIHELVSQCRMLEALYQEASEKVQEHDLQQIFINLIAIHEEVATRLCNGLEQRGERPPQTLTLVDKVNKLYTELKVNLTSDLDYHYSVELVRAEKKLRRSFHQKLKQMPPSELRELIESQLKTLELAHHHMLAVYRDVKERQ